MKQKLLLLLTLLACLVVPSWTGVAEAEPLGSISNDGSAKYLWTPDNAGLRAGTGDFSFAGWVYLNGSANRVFFAKDDNATIAGSEYWCGFEANVGGGTNIHFQVESDNGTTYRADDPRYLSPPLHQWIFICGWFDSVAGTVNFDWNGRVHSVTFAGTRRSTATPFAIGADRDIGNLTPGGYFDGLIGGLGYWRRKLSAAERLSLWNPGATLDAYSGAIGHSWNATFVADVPGALAANVNSTNFDGTGFLSFSYDQPVNLVTGAVSVWFKSNNMTGVICGQSDNPGAYIRLLDSTHIRVQTLAPPELLDFTVPTMSTGTWYNLVLTRTGTATRVYLNGVESSSGAQTQAGTIKFDQIGAYWNDYSNGNGLNYSGRLAELKVFGAVPSGADITALAAGTATALAPLRTWHLKDVETQTVYGVPFSGLSAPMKVGLTSWWNLNEATGTTRHDSIGTNDLTDASGDLPLSGTTVPSLDTTPPTYVSGTVSSSGLVVTLTMSESVLPGSGVTGFVVKDATATRTQASATSSGSTVTITLATPIISAHTATVAYTPGNVTDAASNALATFTAQTLTNSSTYNLPLPPVTLSRTMGNVSVVVGWGTVTGAATYKLYLTGTSTVVTTTTAPTHQYTASVPWNSVVSYQVSVVDTMGNESAKSAPIVVSTKSGGGRGPIR